MCKERFYNYIAYPYQNSMINMFFSVLIQPNKILLSKVLSKFISYIIDLLLTKTKIFNVKKKTNSLTTVTLQPNKFKRQETTNNRLKTWYTLNHL